MHEERLNEDYLLKRRIIAELRDIEAAERIGRVHGLLEQPGEPQVVFLARVLGAMSHERPRKAMEIVLARLILDLQGLAPCPT